MRWNLRMTAARRDIWTATELRARLAQHGLTVSVGKMSKWWSGQLASIKLAELDVLCTVLDCGVEELLAPDRNTRPRLTAARGVPDPHRRAR
ncbi:helix-turn-helix domain-containing protein [Amycolatopsis deserti]|nr:helix-turn-helix transcriptional regulator [Amycolatopsis deserti]